MKLMILSVGRRCEIVEYFKQEFDRVLAVDITEYAPALYQAHEHFILQKDFDAPEAYMDDVIDICGNEKVDAVLTLIDPELLLLNNYRKRFSDIGVKVIISESELITATFDKYQFFCRYKDKLSLVTTFNSYEEVLQKHNFDNCSPVIIKPVKGSGSVGLNTIHYENEFKTLKYDQTFHYIYQPFISGKEFGVDLYFDMFTNKIVSVFMKEKIQMRAGETDKALSIFREDIWEEVKKLEQCGKFSGPVDVDVFAAEDGTVYINEINPRFGGGYPMAYSCGINFIKLIAANLRNETLEPVLGKYPGNIKMMKMQQIFRIDETQEQ